MVQISLWIFRSRGAS